ncbi:protein valois [Condylostylus longicornis]|uniref:protein valois n=1 Tax=Condylostylus longicornis TaxID=2530218 RepID=UPI00244E38B3|nr:protein valois [Condylostylus longicornis]
MQRPNYAKLYKAPKGYVQPETEKLRHDTQHPNYNSLQYQLKPINRTPRILKYYDSFSVNKNGVIALGCNELTGRVWDGYVWGFENLQSLEMDVNTNSSLGVFKIHLDSNVTNVIFVDPKIFAVSQANGSVQIWSTQSENSSTYCPLLIGARKEHFGILLSMTTLNKNNLLVTGCSQGLLKVWDIGKGSLESIHSMHNAHSDSITSISSCFNTESVFVTCSLDRSALIWDYRQQRPAMGIFENHDIDLTAIHWCNVSEADNDLIYLGDAAGDAYMIDVKMPNKFLDKIEVHTRPITKFRFSGSKMAIIGETNMVRIYENRGKLAPDVMYECIYTDSTATNMVRDALWNPQNSHELLSVGWDSKLHRHIVS